MDKNGKIKVQNNKILITNPNDGGSNARIIPAEVGRTLVNGNAITEATEVNEGDVVEYVPKIINAKRHINIKTNEDKTEAYLLIAYENGRSYSLVECEEKETLQLEVQEVVVEGENAISPAEVINILKDSGIKHGIIFGNLSAKMEGEILVAKGESVVEPIDDKIEFLVDINRRLQDEETLEKVDFRNCNKILEVGLNQEIARIIIGKDGVLGKDVFGKILVAKKKKKVSINIGSGCRVLDNIIYAKTEGKLSITNKKIDVNKLYKVDGDVDIKNGNVCFKGDVFVAGKVTEGMEIISDAGVTVEGGVYGGRVLGKSDSNINGNIISSTIEIGGEILEKRMLVDAIDSVVNHLNQIKAECAVLAGKSETKEVQVGSIIKLLIEKKHNDIIRNSMLIISLCNSDITDNKWLSDVLKNKIIGLGPLNIKTMMEVDDIINGLNKEKEFSMSSLLEEAELNISYCQDSKINSSGVINVLGKGIYTSDVKAAKEINFLEPKAVCRGGVIEAKDLIKGSIVGSEGSTITTLKVGVKGKIIIDVAYANTVLYFGNKKYIFDTSAKNVEGFVAPDGTITINKLQL